MSSRGDIVERGSATGLAVFPNPSRCGTQDALSRFPEHPLSGHFVEGRIEREDQLPVPPDALREVLLNAVMHRDYSNPGGDVAVAVFDDRIEISSFGDLLPGITAEMLSGPHPSVLRNPLIARTSHPTGAVEVWGRGTNRVIEECHRFGLEPPTFEHRGNGLLVTFWAKIGPTPQALAQVLAILNAAETPKRRAELMEIAGLSDREHFRTAYLETLLSAGWLEMTIPDTLPRQYQFRVKSVIKLAC